MQVGLCRNDALKLPDLTCVEKAQNAHRLVRAFFPCFDKLDQGTNRATAGDGLLAGWPGGGDRRPLGAVGGLTVEVRDPEKRGPLIHSFCGQTCGTADSNLAERRPSRSPSHGPSENRTPDIARAQDRGMCMASTLSVLLPHGAVDWTHRTDPKGGLSSPQPGRLDARRYFPASPWQRCLTPPLAQRRQPPAEPPFSGPVLFSSDARPHNLRPHRPARGDRPT